MSIFINDFLKREEGYIAPIYIYPVYNNFTIESIRANKINWKKKVQDYLDSVDVIAVVIVYRVNANIVSEKCISKNRLTLRIIKNSIKLSSIFNIVNIYKEDL